MPGRFEFRLADGAANPYLLLAGFLIAGLDGIAKGTDPGPRLDIDMYAQGHTVTDARKLPLNLLDAIRAFDADETLKTGLSEEFAAAYTKLRTADWNSFMRHLSEWERAQTLDV